MRQKNLPFSRNTKLVNCTKERTRYLFGLGAPKYIIGIDFQVGFYGYAILDYDREALTDAVMPRDKATGLVYCPTVKPFYRPWAWARHVASSHKDALTLIEIPDHLARGHGNRGVQGIVSLSLCIGAFATRKDEDSCLLVQPREWKGSQSKERSALLLHALAGVKVPRSQHEADAFHMALWWIKTHKALRITGLASGASTSASPSIRRRTVPATPP